jgi:DNA helicase HerA-like ATPase
VSLELPVARTRALFAGVTGSGKSTEVKRRLAEFQKRGVDVVAVDMIDEYSIDGQADEGLVRLGPLRQRVTAPELAANPGLLLQKRLSLAVIPPNRSRDPQVWARTYLLVDKLLRASPKKRRVLLVVEEIGTACDPQLGHWCHLASRTLSAMALNGRHDGVAMYLCSQRAALVPATARSQVIEVHAFQQVNPEDIAALRERTQGVIGDGLEALQVGQFKSWHAGESAASTPAERPALHAVR